MAEFLPAAQAVLDAQAKERCLFEWSSVNDPPCHPSDPDWKGCVQCLDRRSHAAALREAADQVVPGNGSRKNNEIRAELLAIAAELEQAASNTTEAP
jgi:hypothetical protein